MRTFDVFLVWTNCWTNSRTVEDLKYFCAVTQMHFDKTAVSLQLKTCENISKFLISTTPDFVDISRKAEG